MGEATIYLRGYLLERKGREVEALSTCQTLSKDTKKVSIREGGKKSGIKPTETQRGDRYQKSIPSRKFFSPGGHPAEGKGGMGGGKSNIQEKKGP